MKITKDLFEIEKEEEVECINSLTANMDRTEERVYRGTGEYSYRVFFKILGGKIHSKTFKKNLDASVFIDDILRDSKNSKELRKTLKELLEQKDRLIKQRDSLNNQIQGYANRIFNISDKLEILDKIQAKTKTKTKK